MTAYRDPVEHLADELRRLDLLIGARLTSMSLRNEEFPDTQPARAVYITRDEVDWLLADGRDVMPPIESVALKQLSLEIDARVAAGDDLPLVTLGRLFGLSAVELGAVVVCLAPELRHKYDRVYAYLQDDITRRRPSVDLILKLLCDGEPRRWAATGLFTATAPLLRYGILRPVDDPQSPSGSADLARFLVLDPHIRQFLLGATGLDPRLAGHARIHQLSDTDAETGDPVVGHLVRLSPRVCYLHGPAGAGKLDLAARASHRMGLPLLSLNAATLPERDAAELIRLTFRDALLRDAAVHIADLAPMHEPALRSAIEDHSRPVFLTGEADWAGTLDVHPIAVPLPDADRAVELWNRHLATHTDAAAEWAAELAGRYRLPPARIRAAVRLADDLRLAQPRPRALTLADVAAACRQQSARTLGGAAVKANCRAGWDDLVLPADRVGRLRDIRDQVVHRQRVLNDWGFGTKLSRGTGLTVLFSGGPGTGKTMAAEVLAGDLDLDLYTVDLAGVVSKYIGETERNLARIFEAAASSNAVLFFDEADALFGKRTEVSDAHDRYANIETSYLLQRIEEYEGIVVLATNLRQNMDDAFLRRIRFVVEFPFPEAEDRRRIWQAVIPPGAPLAPDVDFADLAARFAVTGANIRTIAVNAAFLAAADGGVIHRSHILLAVQGEFAKIGKLWTDLPVRTGES
ncbi:ATP-binding protein [Amycolatopsis sp. RTGN1]|uniref:ATP-binding protein n=1 Tax=Amycolatopsis ponsaeliensis TaxID=2992142 RepID=UPI00254F4BAF|nr:ATP-binding protein [Amycolatopsis sp. RTGN1]